MRALLTFVILAGVVAGVFSLGQFSKNTDGKSLLNIAEETPLTVEVAKAERQAITRLVQAPGDVEAVLEVDVSSQIVAKIEEMPVEEGDHVKAGDLLCRLDDDRLRAALESGEARLAQLEAMIRQADADLEKAERDVARQERLSEANATSTAEMSDYLTILKKARAVREARTQERAQAFASLKRLREDLRQTIIESPIDGVISKLSAKQGEVVVTGTMNNPGTVIMSIADLSRMQVRAKVDEVDVPHVQPGQTVRIYLQSDQNKPVPGRVARVAAKGTKQPGRDVVSFETIIEVLSDDPRIKPGMSANVEIEVDRRADAITVPVEAVVHRLRKDLPEEIVAAFDAKQANLDLSDRARQAQYIKVVFIMDEKNKKARLRLIEPGIADSWRVEMREGVALDDMIIVGPYRSLDQLEDGKRVALAETKGKKEEDADKEGESSDDDEAAGETRTAGGDENSGQKKEEDAKAAQLAEG